jgi:hypothetical protein
MTYAFGCGAVLHWGTSMIDRYYLARHAAGLLKLAQATADADLAATLIAKAADLQARIDESGYPDVTPRAPDVERPRLP